MKKTLASLIFVPLFQNCAPPEKKDDLSVLRQAAEFETLDAIWLIWPPADHKEGESVFKVTLSIIEALIEDVQVVITCMNKDLLDPDTRIEEMYEVRVAELPGLPVRFCLW